MNGKTGDDTTMLDPRQPIPGPALQDDADPAETAEWREALQSLLQADGAGRAGYVLDSLLGHAATLGLRANSQTRTAYLNTIPADQEPPFPGNLAVEERIARINRWNALAMVVRANQAHGELGGHIASYASAADLFEVGFNHFFRARTPDSPGDIVYLQPHSAPGVYARAYLEGFLGEDDLAHFRQEITATARGLRGLSSYPHPWLMPDFWQFPTGSMGIGPINAIYQARFMRYLEHRSLVPAADRKVWGIFGDGEMDEPESIAALTLAAREKLDNLILVVNCNLQRLDGPVRGNGRIIDELETLYAGAGWNVIKLVWGSDWDALLRRDTGGALARAFANTVDGQFQTFAANDGAFNRAHFFNQNPELAALVADWSDEAIDRLHRGGHDMVKIHAAYHRAALGGHIPRRQSQAPRLAPPEADQWARFALAADGKEMSSTMAIVRMLTALLKDVAVGPRIVPIVADEARTFGMANLFRQIGIYSAQGQLYEPEDIGSVLYYREARDGQILEEGITEAGAISSWTAAGTSYSVNGLPMLPFYIYYSMFGFQRIGDLIWAAADQRARGFLIGATSGRTTLGGEGLQHQDGSSHVMAAAVPNCRAYDPAYAYEVAVIVEYGMRRMLDEQRDEFFYLTVTNENLAQPDMPRDPATREGILRGLYRLRPARGKADVRLLGAGPMLREAEIAAARLHDDYGVDAEVWSVTSFSELARGGRRAERARVLGLETNADDDWVRACLGEGGAPVIAASDYVRAVPEQIRAYVSAPYRTLGTDGFGRSDTRAQLRDFFEVGADWIVLYALDSLGRQDEAKALRHTLGAASREAPPWEI